jgi:16S rRNA (cytosine1402-N4)-methyltransferase
MERIWEKMKNQVTLSGIDVDEMSVEITKERLALAGAKPSLAVLNFRNIDKALEILGVSNPSKILFDLGWSSDQLEKGERGFSFQKDEPLLMTLKSRVGEEETTAYDVVNRWSEESLSDVIYGYGEEKYARRIAKAIVQGRNQKPIETSKELAEMVKNAVPIFYRFGRIHPATRTFQAVRIAVNDELQALKEALGKGFGILKEGGKIAVISFHSLEDRIVKNFMRELAEKGEGEAASKKPIIASEEEIGRNPRARSAKLRIFKKFK